MKHYLTRAQMRELAEIGIDTRALATHECTENGITYFSLSIGDLIGMLPMKFCTKDKTWALDIAAIGDNHWAVIYELEKLTNQDNVLFESLENEFIDALHDMVVLMFNNGYNNLPKK